MITKILSLSLALARLHSLAFSAESRPNIIVMMVDRIFRSAFS